MVLGMFNKIIDKNKIVEEMNKCKAVKLVNSRKEEFGKMLYDKVYITNDEMKFAFNSSPLEYIFKIKIDNILMYDKKEHQLYIKVM